MTKQATCAERIGDHLNGRLRDFSDMDHILANAWKGVEAEGIMEAAERLDIDPAAVDLEEEARERLYEYPLAVETLRVHKIDLSTGGPADWLEVFVNVDGDITRIVYHFSDWFDHAERTLDGLEFDKAEAFATALIPEL